MRTLSKSADSTLVPIEKLVPGGDGLGHLDDSVVFAPLTAPGDVVSLKKVRKRRGVRFAEAYDLVERSPARRDPPCPWFGDCGGCQWMHMDYPVQLRWKEDILRQALRGIGNIREAPSLLVHKAPAEFEYRFRARMQVKGSAVGYYRRGSNSIVPWDRCMLLPGPLNAAVKDVRALFAQNPAPESLRSCEAALSPVDGNVTYSWQFSADKGNSAAAGKIMDQMERISARREVDLAGQCAHDTRGGVMEARGGSLQLDVKGIAIPVSPGTFFQVNPAVNEILVERSLVHLRSSGARNLLDLYCGHGNFSLPAAAAAIRTVGVESSPGAVRDAQSMAGPGSRFVQMDVARYLAGDTGARDTIIVDPPRTGLPGDVVRMLSNNRCRMLMYVSCEPSTLARDLARLTGSGYVISDMELFDMFPQTFHSEALVVMKGSGPHVP